MIKKEEYAIILDYLPHGYPLEGKMMPVAQAIGEKYFSLLQLIPRRGIGLQLKERVYIGDGKRDKIYYILGRQPREKLTETAKKEIEEFAKSAVEANSNKFINFFNEAEAINTRLHQIELIPGFGKKHTQEIIEARKEEKFESFDSLKKRIHGLPDPKKAIEKRLTEELISIQRHYLFVGQA